MKKTYIIVLFFLISSVFSQTKKEIEFEKTLKDVVTFYNNKNFASLNKLINKENGIYFITKNGVYDYWNLQKEFSSDNLQNPYKDMITQQKIYNDFDSIYTKKYNYDCESKNTEGIFITIKDKRFSTLIEKYINYNDLGLDQKELKTQLKKIKKIECTSRKISLISNDKSNWGKSFIFYLTYSNNKWFLSIIDFASLDCSV